MRKNLSALKAAFPYTIPVMAGYLFLGMVFGVMLSSKGYHFGWAVLMSFFIYAGSMQFVAVNLLSSAFNPLSVFLMTLVVNARHLFYGISMLKKYNGTGLKKPYLIMGLTDETYSILCSTEAPKDVDRVSFLFFVTLLNQIYWVTASMAGGLLGSFFTFDTSGIDFVMTALFVVIFINQWKSQKEHLPAVTGVVVSVLCLIIFGPDNFIIPSMVFIALALTIFRRTIERRA